MTFKELLETLTFYSSIAKILFGPNSALVVGTKGTIFSICHEKIIFKTRIAANSNFPTKFLYTIDICTQCCLGDCMKYNDQSMVNNHIVNFDLVIEMVVNSSLIIILVTNFIKSPPKNPTNANIIFPCKDYPSIKKGGKKKARMLPAKNAW
jgi:hypothetical protein